MHRIARARSQREPVVAGVGRHEFRDAEIDELKLAGARHQHVAWLDVAVDDQRLMRRFDDAAQFDQQLHTLPQGEMLVATVGVYRHAVDEFHHVPGAPILTDAGIDQPRDARMLEAGQRLSFDVKARETGGRSQLLAHQLDGNLLLDRILAPGTVHHAHATRPDLLDQTIAVDQRTGEVGWGWLNGVVQLTRIEGGRFVSPQQRKHARMTGRILLPQFLEHSLALRLVQIEQGLEDRERVLPLLVGIARHVASLTG